MKDETKLKGKDLINIGIYGAIYCVLMTAVAMLGYIPIMMPLLTVIGPIVCGIPMMLFMTKVKKFGMVTIMGIIIGVYLWITGMGFWPAIFGLVCGLITDFIDKSGNYQSAVKTVIGNGIFHILYFGNFLPIYLNSDEYFSTRQSFGQEYITSLSNIMQPWTAPVLFVCCFVSGVIGALLGKKLLKKHFVKAGIV